MSHAPSLLFPSHLSTTSLSACTPVRPSTRRSTRPSLMSTSHGDLPFADPSKVSFGLLAETHTPTSYEPKDLTEEDTSMLVKPMFFHRPKMTSTYDSAEGIATPPPPESDVDDEQIRNMLASPLYLQERSKCRPITNLSLLQRKLSAKFISLPRKCKETLPQCSHTKESRVKRHFPTEKPFPQDINQFWKTNSFQSYGDWSYEPRIWNISKRAWQSTKNWLSEKKHFEKLIFKVITRWRNWKELKKCELTNAPSKIWEKSQATFQELTSQIQELQDRVNLMNDSTEFQDVESVCPVNRQWDVEPRPESATWNLEVRDNTGRPVARSE